MANPTNRRRVASLAALAIAVATASCETTSTTPPTVYEPATGTTIDRCIVRARMTEPEGFTNAHDLNAAETGHGGHANWRVNGGAIHEAFRPVGDFDPDHFFVFGVTLVTGSNHLELARCDEFDRCGWSASEVTVANTAGAPDCAFRNGGAFVDDAYSSGTIAMTSTDRVFLAAPDAMGFDTIVALRLDGTLDTTFGTMGKTTLPSSNTRIRMAKLSSGSFLVLAMRGDVSYLMRLDASGHLDQSFGTQSALAVSSPSDFDAYNMSEIVADGDGAALLGAGSLAGGARNPFILHVDANGARRSFEPIAGGGLPMGYVAAAYDGSARVAFASLDRIVVARIGSGVDTAFGTAGVAMLPRSLDGDPSVSGLSVAWAGTSIGLATTFTNSDLLADARVWNADATGNVRAVDVPFHSVAISASTGFQWIARIAGASDGAFYVASTVTVQPDAHAWPGDTQPGTAFAIARVRDGMQDTTFGTNGISTVSFTNVRTPVGVGTMNDFPMDIGVTIDGAPWAVGRSTSTTAVSTDSFSNRSAALAITRIVN
jgi:hypothetical protein